MNINRQAFIVESITTFNKEKNIEKATNDLLGRMCNIYRFDRIAFFFYDRSTNKFKHLTNIMPSEDNKNKNVYKLSYNDIYDEIIDMNNYNVFVLEANIEREKEIHNMFSKNNVIYTKNIKEITKELNLLNFEQQDDEITEFLIGAMTDEEEVITYLTFEKKHEEYLLEIELDEIKMFLGIIEKRVIETKKLREIDKKRQIDKAMSETSEFDRNLIIVEKDTFNLLFYNDYIEDSEDVNVMNKKCYEIINNTNKVCNDCPILSNELNKSVYTIKNVSTHGEYGEYIIRVSEINWKTENDAYIVSTINATKFVQDKMNTDSLTGHLTWFGIKDKIQTDLTKQNKNNKYAYISIDVDNIKLINDAHSRIVGNEILKQISMLIRDISNEDEYYCRVVADTFAFIIKYIDNENLVERVNQLEKMLTRLFRTVFSEISLVVTGGVYIIEKNLLENLDTAFENTRIARTTVKGSYKNTFAYYNEELKKELKTNKHIEDKVVSAVQNNEFLVYLQPKFEIETKKVIGAEALARWQSPEEMIYPDKFIPVFEKNGFVLTLDFIIYEKVFKFIRECLDENIDIMPISINASRNHLRGDDFLKKVLRLLEKYNIPKDLIEIEITENASEDSDNKLHNFVEDVRAENIAVSMDDFGSAYSSLNLLKTLYVDSLKLDKEFLDKMDKCRQADVLARDEIIIKNVVHMAKELDFKVICEGVETEEQIEFLKKIGCDYGQGFVFSKPLPLEEFKSKFLI